ncbi:outer membrane protein [Bradyrhizobium sp. USDA 10063]
MKKVLLGTIALIALAAPACAADLAVWPYAKTPPMVALIYDWSGFYIDMNGGGGSAHQCWDLVNAGGVVFAPPLAMGCHSATGGTLGGETGYRWQIANSVFGLEAQGNWADFKGSNTNLAFAGLQDETKIDAFGLFTGQVGYAWNNVLLYVKGGRSSPTVAKRAGAAGTGLEFGFAPNRSVGVECDYLFMGHRDVNFFSTGTAGVPAGPLAGTARVGQDVGIGLVPVNYRWSGADVVKY